MDEGIVIMIGCFDTKSEEFFYMYRCLRNQNLSVFTLDVGVMASITNFPIDVPNSDIAIAAGTPISVLRKSEDRGYAVKIMGDGAAKYMDSLISSKNILGVIGMGGGGGTYIILEAMQKVPLGVPKFCISTVAAKDLTTQIGIKDIILMSSVVDIAGLNFLNKLLIKQAACAFRGMVNVGAREFIKNQKRIAISMFGNTTKCVTECRKLLQNRGFEVMVFHATGTGGRAMEALIREGFFSGVLDITTTELADELCGGLLSAGPSRLTAAAETGVPQIVVPGCLDMVNFSTYDTVPKKYLSRTLYNWAPDVILMRTNLNENLELARLFANKLSGSRGKVEIVLPLKGLSQIDHEGNVFYSPEINDALFAAIKNHVKGEFPVIELEAHINDEVFSKTLVDRLLNIL